MAPQNFPDLSELPPDADPDESRAWLRVIDGGRTNDATPDRTAQLTVVGTPPAPVDAA